MLDMFQVAAERCPLPDRQRILFEIRHCLGGNLFQLEIEKFPVDGGTRRILFFRRRVLWSRAEAVARVKNAGHQDDGKERSLRQLGASLGALTGVMIA